MSHRNATIIMITDETNLNLYFLCFFGVWLNFSASESSCGTQKDQGSGHKDFPLSDFKLHQASEGTVVRTWPVSSVEDLAFTPGTCCSSNDFKN